MWYHNNYAIWKHPVVIASEETKIIFCMILSAPTKLLYIVLESGWPWVVHDSLVASVCGVEALFGLQLQP